VWIEILDGAPKHSCFLSFADNISAVSWLHKANIDETKHKPFQAAIRHFANLLIKADCCLYRQHFRGCENKVANHLSRKFELTNKLLENLIFSKFSSQVPSTFRLIPIPQSISSWVTWLLQKVRETTESQKGQKRKRKESGDDGLNIATSSKIETTCTYKTSLLLCKPPSSVHSQLPSKEVSFLALTKKSWLLAQSKRSWQR
jgi:CTP synthase (UTP-ammonia lyase)